MKTAGVRGPNRLPICSFASGFLIKTSGPKDPSNGTASGQIGKDADYNRLSVSHLFRKQARSADEAPFACSRATVTVPFSFKSGSHNHGLGSGRVPHVRLIVHGAENGFLPM